ncbi:hypothetical protein [Arthrobacter sp. PAMC 25486]|uniref:hypothetical protein n=1 Tax=Arthrobacter sp. PAMC 25486 TaxID=1494608 RepID=UPI0012FEBD56|nr:hypothetical protein [Arthrobacter sp. PAMC 25486]
MRVISSGELGNIAYRTGTKMFYMDTVAGGLNTKTVVVHMDGTGEFKAYALSALENSDDKN